MRAAAGVNRPVGQRIEVAAGRDAEAGHCATARTARAACVVTDDAGGVVEDGPESAIWSFNLAETVQSIAEEVHFRSGEAGERTTEVAGGRWSGRRWLISLRRARTRWWRRWRQGLGERGGRQSECQRKHRRGIHGDQ